MNSRDNQAYPTRTQDPLQPRSPTNGNPLGVTKIHAIPTMMPKMHQSIGTTGTSHRPANQAGKQKLPSGERQQCAMQGFVGGNQQGTLCKCEHHKPRKRQSPMISPPIHPAPCKQQSNQQGQSGPAIPSINSIEAGNSLVNLLGKATKLFGSKPWY